MRTSINITQDFSQYVHRNSFEYLPDEQKRDLVLDKIHESNKNDVFIIVFRKKDGVLTQRVASKLSFANHNLIRFWSSIEPEKAGFRSAKIGRIFSLTKVPASEVGKLYAQGLLL